MTQRYRSALLNRTPPMSVTALGVLSVAGLLLLGACAQSADGDTAQADALNSIRQTALNADSNASSAMEMAREARDRAEAAEAAADRAAMESRETREALDRLTMEVNRMISEMQKK